MSTASGLIKARELILRAYDPSVPFIASAGGACLDPGDLQAKRFSLSGAVHHACALCKRYEKDTPLCMEALRYCLDAMSMGMNVTVWESQPGRTMEDALWLLDTALVLVGDNKTYDNGFGVSGKGKAKRGKVKEYSKTWSTRKTVAA